MKKYSVILYLLIALAAKGQDHNLDYYLGQADTNSPLLRDYEGQQLSARLDSQLLRATYKIQVNGLSNDSYAPVFSGFGYDNAVTNGGQLSAQVQATHTFVGKNNLSAQLQSFSLDSKSIGNTAAIARKDLKKTVTAQYITAYGDKLTMDFNEEILHLLEKEESILKGLTQNNIYNQADYLAFFVTLQQQQLLLKESRMQFINDYAGLNYLCGIVDTSSSALPDPDIRLSLLPDAYSSVFYRQFTIDSLKNINQRSIISYSYKPKLSTFADAGYLSSLAYQAQKNFGASFGLTLNVPIYDGKQKQLRYAKIDIAERTRTSYRDFFLKQYDQQIAQLSQQLHATESLINDINGQIKYTDGLIQANLRLLEKGSVRITDLILAINTYLNARHLLNQNYVSRLQLINQINYWNSL